MHKNSESQMLRFAMFSQFNGAQFWIVLFIVTVVSEIAWYILLFDIRQFMRSFRKCCSFWNDICIFFFYFEPQETNRTKILRKLWCTLLQIGVESVKGEERTSTYPPAFFLPLVFENSSQSFIEYSTVTFGFDPCALLPTGYRKRAGSILFSAFCLSAYSDIKKWLLSW